MYVYVPGSNCDTVYKGLFVGKLTFKSSSLFKVWKISVIIFNSLAKIYL